MEIGPPFHYKGYEVTIVESDEDDAAPAWSSIDARTGKRIILLLEGTPKKFLEPLLEHEIYELENNFNHQKAIEVGREKAEELGVLDEFLEFEKTWNRRELEIKEK